MCATTVRASATHAKRSATESNQPPIHKSYYCIDEVFTCHLSTIDREKSSATFDRGASRYCVPATGHAMHWQMIGENATMFWPSALKLRSIGLFGLVLRFKLQV